MDDQRTDVRKIHSSYVKQNPNISQLQKQYKSDVNVICNENSSSLSEDQYSNNDIRYDTQRHTKYHHDEVPVKDDNSFTDGHDYGRGDTKNSIVFSIDEIEMKILKKMSQELQTDDNSMSSLDSNIKLFKTTVNQILENFYTNMQDFELYKKKFNEILQKNKGDSVAEMENFIKDMIQHIGSSESTISDNKTKIIITENNFSKGNICQINTDLNKETESNSLNSTIEAFKNENYLTDSTFDHNSSKFNAGEKKDFLNIFFLSGTRYVQIKMNDRSLFSEINIRDQYFDGIKEPLASAENIKKVEAKRNELENYAKQERHIKDRDIPVKNSCAKKNIHLDDDSDNDKDDCHKFFIFRICNYICRKIRKNAFG